MVRHDHKHLSGVYPIGVHLTIDVFFTGGRDTEVHVWEVPTKALVYVFGSHTVVINSVAVAADDPQILSASSEGSVRLWGLLAGAC